jgi:hypothetical protein
MCNCMHLIPRARSLFGTLREQLDWLSRVSAAVSISQDLPIRPEREGRSLQRLARRSKGAQQAARLIAVLVSEWWRVSAPAEDWCVLCWYRYMRVVLGAGCEPDQPAGHQCIFRLFESFDAIAIAKSYLAHFCTSPDDAREAIVRFPVARSWLGGAKF